MALPGEAEASLRPANWDKGLHLRHYQTRDTLDVTFWSGGAYDGPALRSINHFLRDRRVDKSHHIDLSLVDGLHQLVGEVGADAPIDVLSAYRTARTNSMLVSKYKGVAPNSFHLKGMAVDLRLENVRLRHIRDAAMDLGIGGVGYYPRRGFVHLDVGPRRTWRG